LEEGDLFLPNSNVDIREQDANSRQREGWDKDRRPRCIDRSIVTMGLMIHTPVIIVIPIMYTVISTMIVISSSIFQAVIIIPSPLLPA
jgi:hypothetical protein